MTYEVFLQRVIHDGIFAAEMDYAEKPDHRTGAVAGFLLCEEQPLEGLRCVLETVRSNQTRAAMIQHPRYWLFRCLAAEVEWVCNCVSAWLYLQQRPPLAPCILTARGLQKAMEVLRA